MNRDDIIRMALETRLVPQWLELCPKDEKALVRFAALVAAAEREACAKVCDGVGYNHEVQQGAELAFDLADAIRARGNT